MENIIKKSFMGIITVCITVIDIIDEVTLQLFHRILKLTRERINQSVIEVNRNVNTNVSNVSEHLIKCILYHAIHVCDLFMQLQYNNKNLILIIIRIYIFIII